MVKFNLVISVGIDDEKLKIKNQKLFFDFKQCEGDTKIEWHNSV